MLCIYRYYVTVITKLKQLAELPILFFPSHYTASYLIDAGVVCYSTLDYTQCDITLRRAPVDEGSARCKDIYMTTRNSDKRQTSRLRRDSNPQTQQASDRRRTP